MALIDQVVSFNDHPVPLQPFVTPPERLIAGDPAQTIALYTNELDGKLIAGLWESEPGKWEAVAQRREFCVILEGRVIISDEAGGEKVYTAGDSFMLPYGFKGYWEVTEFCRKYFVILQD
ncbi:cupin domain-containing protein [Neptunomonas marina]|uniref:DUF861 domain-containing protein n=1 Tax=Neptunomonas marina TaxID=1815562 RepID=A0A437QE40_9GAMM|nr:cupin domain-containing protein [Neptunomonas marina]RVU32832.1 DUF861 domain-containing protein [Neptunomonas marina]